MQRQYITVVTAKQHGVWHLTQAPILTTTISTPKNDPVTSASIPVTVRKRATPLHAQALKPSDPLAVFIAKNSGIDPHYAADMWAGEIRSIIETRKLPSGALRKDAPLTLEEMAEWAYSFGYLTDPDPRTLLETLLDDCVAALNGTPRILSFDGKELRMQHDADEYYQELEEGVAS